LQLQVDAVWSISKFKSSVVNSELFELPVTHDLVDRICIRSPRCRSDSINQVPGVELNKSLASRTVLTSQSQDSTSSLRNNP